MQELNLLSPATAPPDSPLGLLTACHRRIEQRLALLDKIADAVEAGDPAGQVPEAIEFVLSYFHDGLQRHTADEDLDFFPLVRQTNPELEPIVLGLEADHRAFEFVHNDLDAVLAEILHSPRAALAGRLRELAAYLVPLYQHHLQVEEDQVFTQARLSGDQSRDLSLRFQGRRR